MNAAMLNIVASIAFYSANGAPAEVTIHCDNSGTLELSTDNGSTFETIATGNHWPTAITATLEDGQVTCDTILRLTCTDSGVIGGVIATVTHNGDTYSTTEPIEDGPWQLVSSSDGVTSPLVYHDKTASPWHISTAGIADDAKWIWNENIHNTMVFDFDFDFGNGLCEFGLIDFEYTSIETGCGGEETEIGWLRYSECEENAVNGGSTMEYPTLSLSEMIDLAQYAVTVKILPKDDIPGQSESEEFAVTACTCSNPIFALNNGKELSFELDLDTGLILSLAQYEDNWMGSDTALDRLRNICIPSDVSESPRDLSAGFIYHACGNAATGLHLFSTTCMWEYKEVMSPQQDVAVWLGFYASKLEKCKEYGTPLFDVGFEYTSTETGCYGEETEIGWIRYSECEENANSGGSIMEYPTLSLSEIIDLAQYAVTVKILPKDDIPGQSESEEFAVTTCTCSNPVFALNNGKELSYELDLETGLISSLAQYENNWMGSDIALDRLRNSCIPSDVDGSPRDLSTGFIYHACGNAATGLHLFSTTCMWEFKEVMSPQQDVVVWLGFYASKFRKCEEYKTPLFNIDFEYTSTETGCDGEESQIGWVRYSECEENAVNGGSTMEYPTLTLPEMIDLAQYAVTVKILPKDDIPGQSESEAYAVTTCACSNPIFALNNGKELSFELDLDTGLIESIAQYEDNWMGSDEALDRLRNSCIPSDVSESPRDLSTGFIYHACGNAATGLHLFSTTCMWEYKEVMSPQQDVVVWLGFYASKFEKCEEYPEYEAAGSAKQPPFNQLDVGGYNENYMEVMVTSRTGLYIFWIVGVLLVINCICLGYYVWNKGKSGMNRKRYHKVRTIDTEDESQ